MWWVFFLPLAWACPSKEFIVLRSDKPGELVCERSFCPNITCIGILNQEENTCYSWTCNPSLSPSIPPPYTQMHLKPVSEMEVLFNFFAFLFLVALSPTFALGLFIGHNPRFEFET